MPVVDPDDDVVWRWVLQHYRFDPQRRQRRNVTVAAFDNATEFDAALAAYGERIRAEIDAGERDPHEHVAGVVWHPGYHAEQARGRLGCHRARCRPKVRAGRRASLECACVRSGRRRPALLGWRRRAPDPTSWLTVGRRTGRATGSAAIG